MEWKIVWCGRRCISSGVLVMHTALSFTIDQLSMEDVTSSFGGSSMKSSHVGAMEEDWMGENKCWKIE